MIDFPDGISVVLRAVSFVLLFQAAGAAVFLAALGSALIRSFQPIRRVALVTAFLAIVAVTGHFLLDAARMAGEFIGALDPQMQRLSMMSSSGAAFACRVAGLLIIGLALQVHARRAALLGVFAVATSFALTGHTSVSPLRVALAPMLFAHVAIGMFWFGSLWPLYLVSLREPPAIAGHLVEVFSKAAAWTVPVILVVGVAMTALLVPGWAAVFTDTYGKLLLLKLLLFAVLMVFAAANRWRFGPAIGRAQAAAAEAGRAFRRTVIAEIVLICCVLVATACLTEFFSPQSDGVA